MPARGLDIVGAPLRTLPPLVADKKKIRFGTIGVGMDLPRVIWSSECQVFSSQAADLTRPLARRPPKLQVRKWDQLPLSFWGKHPTDVLLIDAGQQGETHALLLPTAVTAMSPAQRPLVIVVAGPIEWLHNTVAQEWRKIRRKTLERSGYTGLEWFVNAQEQGSALHQERLVEVFIANPTGRILPTSPAPQGLPTRAMQNLLIPFGVPSSEWAPRKAIQWLAHPHVSEEGFHVLGHIKNKPIYGTEGCMPEEIGSWIADGLKGVRRLQIMEVAKGKGLPGEWLAKGAAIDSRVVAEETCLHIWTAVCDEIGHWLKTEAHVASAPSFRLPPRPSGQLRPPQGITEDIPSSTTDALPTTDPLPVEWIYDLPNLQEGGQWYRDRCASLDAAIRGRPNSTTLRSEGLDALKVHRDNYTPEGPKYLQVLWWEFPEPHQDAVRLGSSMRFLVDPGVELIPNPPLTPEQLDVVCLFVEELRSLGVVRNATKPLRRVCPLFVVSKPGQPGQWRCIADMKRGGQNGCCSLDPIILPSAQDILPCLYEGGWTGIADASKYFHNYLTLPQERDLIGIIHPRTEEHLWYVGLPMGSVNSPSIACRIGEGIMDLLRRESSLFRVASYQENTWRQALSQRTYQPQLGHGYVGFQASGKPVALVYGFVDDFKIHGVDQADCCQAMTAFMDLMVRLGLICQKAKTSPPQQIQKYCGFLYNTIGTPTLHVPPNKISRCVASAEFLLHHPRTNRLSRLSLAIVTGILQSVVEATPQRIGQSYLRSLYDDLHHLTEGAPTQGAAKYYTCAFLSEDSRRALRWWTHHLTHSTGSTTYRASSGRGIVLKWGDGSGTGTGGTTEFYELTPDQAQSPGIELWMGVWGARSKPRTSNWKEARTVLESLLQERDTGRLNGMMVFYMTDNLVSYYIINQGSSRSPGLHELVLEIKEICLELGCQLEVVHVPGTLMIIQGTDGQSRGLWMAPERRVEGINQHLFDPVPYTTALGLWAMAEVGFHDPNPPEHLAYNRVGDYNQIQGRLTIWTPPPECGRLVLTSYLRSWVQSPMNSRAIFLLPRILQRQWGRVAKYIKERGVYHAGLLPPSCSFVSHLPFVLLFIAPHTHVRRKDRMELPAPAQPPGWHKHQAEQVRGLS